ncbi:MAG TPA: hypothetical protein VFE93_16115 [Myxococcaceae bacterium]|nr:hypothetical protein [Myxococcaceae bacterium]
MGLFDFIGDAFGAIASPFAAVIDAGTKLLGLPPALGDALKIAVGAATGDFVTLMQGSTQLLKDLAGSAAETEYAPPKDEAYGGTDGWAPTASARSSGASDDAESVEVPEEALTSVAISEDQVVAEASEGDQDPEEARALEALGRNFDALNRDHGPLRLLENTVITEQELHGAAEDPDAPLELKRAARYVLDHPDLLERLSRSKDRDQQGISRSDIDLVKGERQTGGGSAAAMSEALVASGTDVEGSAIGDVDPEEKRALDTLRQNFDAMNRDHGFLGAFGDKVITEKELRETAEDAEAPLDLKRAARYVLDHPDLLERLSRSRDGDDQGIARSDVDLAAEQSSSGTGGTSGTSRTPAGDELSALQTLFLNFDRLNRPVSWLPGFDKVLTREELELAASNADTPPTLKRAVQYVLDHPALLTKLSRSKGVFGEGISRSDLEIGIADARRTGSGTKPKQGGSPAAASSGGSTGKSSSSSSSRSRDPSITDILNDKSLSIEEKIEMILMVLENRVDDQMLQVTRQMDQNDDKKTAKDDRKKVSQLDKVDRDLNFKMERLMKRKEQLSNLLSTMEMKFASMAQTAIANMGR